VRRKGVVRQAGDRGVGALADQGDRLASGNGHVVAGEQVTPACHRLAEPVHRLAHLLLVPRALHGDLRARRTVTGLSLRLGDLRPADGREAATAAGGGGLLPADGREAATAAGSGGLLRGGLVAADGREAATARLRLRLLPADGGEAATARLR